MNFQKKTNVYGFGITGKSIVSYLLKKNHKLIVIDNKKLSEDQKIFFKNNNIEYSENENEINDLSIIEQCFVSPGVDLRKSFFQECIKNKIPIRNDTFFLNQIDRKKTKLIGINNRNLKTMEVDINTSLTLKKYIDPNKIIVAESGLKNHADLLLFKKNNIHNFLIGESLMKEQNLTLATKKLLGLSN